MNEQAPAEEIVRSRLPDADPRIHTFFAAWNAARHGKPIPSRRDFDPLAVAPLLKFVWIYRYEPDIPDFVCRLAGENVNDAWGRSIKGRRLLDIVGAADHPVVMERWLRILREPSIQYGARQERLSALDLHRAERLILPLTGDSGEAEFVLGISLYTVAHPDPNRPPLISEDIVRIPCAEM